MVQSLGAECDLTLVHIFMDEDEEFFLLCGKHSRELSTMSAGKCISSSLVSLTEKQGALAPSC